ncbi:phosphatase PAP2 family protein [Candidatus Saccharibacteria bacterium]|nr:phosphatase PAP2 family protein [Candidatus Saccharibacteria bacterium]
MQWDKATDIILIAAIAVLCVFTLLGLYQWIRRKSLKKVDRALLAMMPPLILMAITYVIFDKFFILNIRPNGSGEPSFPSTHVMVVTTIFFLAMNVLPKYIKSKALCALLDVVMLALISITATGRVLSDMHWISDVIGGLAFAVIFTVIYCLIKKEKHV